MATVYKYKKESVNVYAVKRNFFTREKIEKTDKRMGMRDREYLCYKCGHEFGADEMIALAFVNLGDGNQFLCQPCATEVLKQDSVWESNKRAGDTHG